MKHLRVFEAFAGYGSQAMALKRLQADFPDRLHCEFVGISEIDRYAIAAYRAVHGDTRNYGDITKINWGGQMPEFNLFTYSFPCQDISTAGLQRGFSEGSGSRSSLLWECRKAIETKRPAYLLMENVKALKQKKFMPDFQRWIDYLNSLGYRSYWAVLNSKDYGIPQNRERVFMVSFLDHSPFAFPKTLPLTIRLRDVLEHDVDESYYLSDEHVKNILEHCARKINEGCGFKPNFVSPDDICGTITAMYGQRQTDPYLQLFIGEELQTPLNALQGGDIAPTIPAHYYKAGFRDFMPKISPAHVPHLAILEKCEGKILQMPHGYNLGSLCDIASALTTSKWQDNNFAITGYRIRKLTEREVFRLMGVTDAEIDKINAAEYQHGRKRKQIPKTQKYKMGGNSIVVDVLYHVFKAMFIDEPPKPQPIQYSLFDDFPTT